MTRAKGPKHVTLKPGLLFTHNKQAYFCRSTSVAKTRAGVAKFELFHLESLCADCGKLFTLTVGKSTYYYNKRCPKHKRKGVLAISKTIFD